MKWEDINEGDELPPYVKGPITREGIQAYGRASGDLNPIHMSEKAAISAGLGGVIAHGLNSMAFVCQMMTSWLGKDGRLKSVDVQFRGMVRPGDIVTSKGKVVRKYEEGGQKWVDVDIVQETLTEVAKGKITQFENVGIEWEESAKNGWLRNGDQLTYEVVKQEKGEDKKNRIEFRIYRKQRSILGKATASF